MSTTLKYRAASILEMLRSEEIGPVWWVYEPLSKTQRHLLAKYPNNAKTDTADAVESVVVLEGKLNTIFGSNPQAVVIISFAGNANEPEDRRFTFRVCGNSYQEPATSMQPLAGLAGLHQQGFTPPSMVSKEHLETHMSLLQQQFALQLENAKKEMLLAAERQKLEDEKRELKELKAKYESRVESTKQAVSDAAEPLITLAGAFIKDTFKPGQVAPALAGIDGESFAAQLATHVNTLNLNDEEEDVFTQAINKAEHRIAQMRQRRALPSRDAADTASAGGHPDAGADDETGRGDA
jgi:hypothetical protein